MFGTSYGVFQKKDLWVRVRECVRNIFDNYHNYVEQRLLVVVS